MKTSTCAILSLALAFPVFAAAKSIYGDPSTNLYPKYCGGVSDPAHQELRACFTTHGAEPAIESSDNINIIPSKDGMSFAAILVDQKASGELETKQDRVKIEPRKADSANCVWVTVHSVIDAAKRSKEAFPASRFCKGDTQSIKID